MSIRPSSAFLSALVLALATACGGSRPPEPVSPPDATPVPGDSARDDRHAGATIASLGAAMATGELDAHALAAWHLGRIAALDDAGPALNAVIAVSPDALEVAQRLDRERAAGRSRGPLHGIPIVVKDNIDTADLPTTAGSLALATHRPAADAPVVARLREAGVVILGKANLSEWANFRSTNSTSGWSSVGGQTRNPHALDRNPCGSSSGTAVAVAAGLAVAGVGTETNGSIVCPASANGIVGIKPTLGWVAGAGIVPIAASQDTAGPMARTVADAALLYAGMIEPAADGVPPEVATLLADASRTTDLTGLRIGIVRGIASFDPAVEALYAKAIADLRAIGAEIVDPVSLPPRASYAEAEFTVLLTEFRSGIDAYLGATGPEVPVKSLAELVAFNRDHADAVMPHFGQELLERALAAPGLDDPAYREARERARRIAGAEGIDAALARDRLDVLVAPTGGPAWLSDPVNGDCFGGGSSAPAAVSGYPNLTVPMGHVRGLPVGLSVFGGRHADVTLVRVAAAFEAATRHRRPPGFAATVADIPPAH